MNDMTDSRKRPHSNANFSKQFRIKSALIGTEWIDDCLLSVEDGLIVSVQPFADSNADNFDSIDGAVIPGVANVHSHAFQRGFAGLSEFRTSDHDSFWSWRTLMYEFVWKLTPEHAYVIAKQVYLEMLAAGYTWVGEFHYLHNDMNGERYSNAGEMSDVLMNAAMDAGIGIRLLPTLYQLGGFGREIEDKQKRFRLDEEQFIQLVSDIEQKWKTESLCQVGIALHSLRAVDVCAGQRVVDAIRPTSPRCPIHIHVSEQKAELEECKTATGKTPIELLYDSFDVDDCWCLIHSTHASPPELSLIAQSKAIVGLCPTTEANLGDGIFPSEEFLAMDGRFAIGSDSHVSINLASELRTIEYGQRLSKNRRAVLGTENESVGARLFRSAAVGGGKAIGVNTGSLAVGSRADFIVVDSEHAAIGGVTSDLLLDRLVFCEYGNPISKTYVGGEAIDAGSRMDNHRTEFLKTMKFLQSNSK